MQNGGTAATALAPSNGQRKALMGVEEHMACLDRKMDRLSAQMDKCLSGIRGLAAIKARAMYGEHPHGQQPWGALQDSSPAELPLQTMPPGRRAVQRSSLATLRPALRSPADRASSCGSAGGQRPTRQTTSCYTANPAADETVPHRCPIGPVQLKVWKFMSNPESSFTAGVYNRLNSAFILLVVLFSAIQITSPHTLSAGTCMGIECSIEALFLLQISALFAVCPHRRHFLLQIYNVIDVLSAMPLALRVYELATGDSHEIYAVVFGRLVPAVRLLKTMRHFQTSRP